MDTREKLTTPINDVRIQNDVVTDVRIMQAPMLVAKKGSTIASAVSVLSKTIIGVGLLGLSWAFNSVGMYVGLMMLTFSGLLASFTLHLLSCVAVKVGGDDVSFFMLSQITFPSIKYVLDGAIFVKCLGVATSYLIVLSHHLPHILPKPSEETMSQSTYRAVTLILAVLIFVAPASFPKRIRSLRFTNWAALGCMLYITMLIVYCYFTGYADPVDGLTTLPTPLPNVDSVGNFTIPTLDDGLDDDDFLINTMEVDKPSVDIVYWTTDPIAIINAIPIFIFAFGCHQNLFTISNELLDRSVKRLDAVVALSVGVSLLGYGLVAVCGYLTFGTAVSNDVLQNYKSNSTPFFIARVGIALSMVFSYPLQCHPCRRSLWVLLFQDRTFDRQKERYILRLFTALILVATTAVAIAVDDLGLLFKLVGAVGSNTMCFIMPGFLYLVLFREEGWTWKRCASLGVFILGCCILPVCLGVLFYGTAMGH